MHNPTDRILHTTAFVTPVVEPWLEREIAPWVHPRKDRSDDLSHHERMLLWKNSDSKNSIQFTSIVFNVQALIAHTPWAYTPVINWAVCQDRRLVVVTLLEISERDEGVVPLKTRSGLDPVPRCEPSTCQSIRYDIGTAPSGPVL